MAVKFSQFTTASALSDISYLVGYKGTANIQIAPSLLAGTTYSLDVPTLTTNINLAGSNSTNDAITLTGGTDITLTRVSASEISIASTASGDTYTLGATTDGSNVDLNLDDYSILVIPGGVKAMEKVRQNKSIIKFISEFDRKKKLIACICSGAQLLISAKVVKGRKISGYYSMEDDLINAGAIYTDLPAVIDDNIITTAHYKDMGPWMKAVIEKLNS